MTPYLILSKHQIKVSMDVSNKLLFSVPFNEQILKLSNAPMFKPSKTPTDKTEKNLIKAPSATSLENLYHNQDSDSVMSKSTSSFNNSSSSSSLDDNLQLHDIKIVRIIN